MITEDLERRTREAESALPDVGIERAVVNSVGRRRKPRNNAVSNDRKDINERLCHGRIQVVDYYGHIQKLSNSALVLLVRRSGTGS